MAVVKNFVSDLSGEPIAEGDHARITITAGEAVKVLDVTMKEAEGLFKNQGRDQKKRGRKAKAAE